MDGSQPAPITSISSASPFASSPAPPKQPFPQSMNLSFESQTPGSHEPGPYFHQNSALTPYNPLNNNNNESGGGGNNSNNKGEFGGGEGMKKKRGRPRKYGPDGAMGLGLKSGGSGSGVPGGSAANAVFKKMGRPPGSSKKKQLEALGASGVAFTPHIITVPPGEDVASKIMAFSQQGPRTICILSANGAISNVSLRQAATSGGLVTYEGRFEIISLSGSFLLAQDGDTKSRTGGLSVALSGSDGRVLGGCVAGMLLAATPVQVVVGSFIAEGKKPKQNPDPIISPHSHSHSHSHSQPIPAPPLTSPHLPSPQPIRPGPPPHFGTPGPHNMNNNNSPFGAPPPAGNSPGSDVMSDEYSSSNEDEDHDDGPMQHHVAPRFSDPGRASHFNHMGWPISSVDGGNNNNQNRRE